MACWNDRNVLMCRSGTKVPDKMNHKGGEVLQLKIYISIRMTCNYDHLIGMAVHLTQFYDSKTILGSWDSIPSS